MKDVQKYGTTTRKKQGYVTLKRNGILINAVVTKFCALKHSSISEVADGLMNGTVLQ